MRYLRKNTAVIVAVGPFFDKTDGVTLETGLTITNERITLIAETDDGNAPTLVLDNVTGATSATDNDLNYITGQDNAMMQLELSAANVNRLGRMFLTITDAANHCPVFHKFSVMNAALYDAFFATSGGAIPNVAADAAGGIPISDAGGLDMDAILSRMGTPSDFGSGASVAKNLVDIEAQTDDIGIAGAGLTALGDTRIANLDATVSSRLATAGYTTPPTAAAIADAVMDETATSHTGALKDVYDNAIQIGAAGAGLTALPAALLATVADGSLTVADSLKLSNAANAGKTAGPVPGTAGTVTLLNTAGTKTRVSTSVDTSGYRTTNPTLDLS